MYTIEIDTDSPAYKRVTEAGFTISNLTVADSVCFTNEAINVSFHFKCVCGRHEIAAMTLTKDVLTGIGMSNWFYGKKCDAAKILEDVGAISIAHLLADGFTDEQICDIRKPYGDTMEHIKLRREMAA